MSERDAKKLTHLNETGEAHMVDVGAKAVTRREAVAAGSVRMRAETLALIQRAEVAKGDVLATARIAGIMAAKRTSELIPLCHPLAISHVQVAFESHPAAAQEGAHLDVIATVRTTDRTGVEMEALTAATVAALTVYDMCKAVDRGMELTDFHLRRKAGGKSGTFVHPRYADHSEDPNGGVVT